MRRKNQRKIKKIRSNFVIGNITRGHLIAINVIAINVIAINILIASITLFTPYINTYGEEREGVTVGKEILKAINKKSWKNVNSSSNENIKNYQKELNGEMVDWTKNLEKSLNEDVKSQSQTLIPDIKATKEDKRIAKEIVEKSQAIIHESLGMSQDQNTASVFGTDFLIFASFSMGEKNLKSLIKQAARYNGVVALRGLKNGDLKETAKFLLQFMDKSTNKCGSESVDNEAGGRSEGIAIDPNLFEEYSVTKVPTYVLTKPCEDIGVTGTACKPKYDKLTGNVSPRYALEKFSTSGELAGEARERLGR